MVLLARRPPKGRRLLILATSSNRPVLTDLGLSEIFDAELRVPPIATLRALDIVLREVELFQRDDERRRAVGMLAQAGFSDAEDADAMDARTTVGIKKLLSMVEMARQEPDAAAERLMSALMGLGM